MVYSLPRFIQGTALSLAISACSGSQLRPKPVEDNVPASDPQAKPNFASDSLAFKPYQMLMAGRVKPNDLDIGCKIRDYNTVDPTDLLPAGKRPFEGDSKIEPCEVFDYVLPRYKEYPEIASEIAGGVIPWALTDPEVPQAFTQEISGRIDNAIVVLRNHPEIKKLDPKTDEYRDLLGTGLYYFTAFPDTAAAIDAERERWERFTSPLTGTKLESFRTWLFANGGLGTWTFESDRSDERSAIKTLYARKGWCTELSKVLYAVFSRARLEADFIGYRSRDVDAGLIKHNVPIPSSSATSHVNVGLRLAKRHHVFDLSLQVSPLAAPGFSPDFDGGYVRNLRQFLVASHSNLAITLTAQEKFDAALSIYRSALELSPYDPKVVANMASTLWDNGKQHATFQILHDARNIYPKNAFLLEMLGVYYARSKDYETAISYYKRSLELDPNEPRAYDRLGISYRAVGRIEDAIQASLNAIRLGALDPRIYFNLARHLDKQQRYAESEQIYRTVLELDPEYPNAHNNLAMWLQEKGDLDEAEKHFRKAVKFNPGRSLYNYNLGDLLVEKGSTMEAIQFFWNALVSKPDHSVALKRLVEALIATKGMRETINILKTKADESSNTLLKSRLLDEITRLKHQGTP